MQVYRGLDIGTAKPSVAEQKSVPHYLIDVVELNQAFDAAQFVEQARAAVAQIQSRGRVPIFCGGTGLYFKAFTEGLGEAPPSSPELRAQLEAMPIEALLCELEKSDPTTFQKIDRQNQRRLVRALEVIRLTGKPFSAQRASWASASYVAPPNLFGLARHPEDLHRRIHQRVDEMFAAGLVAETQSLLTRGLAENRTAMQALGYRQVVEHLQGEYELPQTIEWVKIRTRQFAKRQMTWFRRQLALTWIALDEKARPEEVAAQIASGYVGSV